MIFGHASFASSGRWTSVRFSLRNAWSPIGYTTFSNGTPAAFRSASSGQGLHHVLVLAAEDPEHRGALELRVVGFFCGGTP